MNDKFSEVSVIRESEHNLFGLGNVRYVYSQRDKRLEIYTDWVINSDNKSPTILLTGNAAKNSYFKFIGMEEEKQKLSVDMFLHFIYEITGLTLDDLKVRTRKFPNFFCRQLVMWASIKFLKYSDTNSGNIFSLDRVTALHGFKVISKDNKFLKQKEVELKTRFIRMLNNKIRKSD